MGRVVTALLFSSDRSLIESCRQVVEAIPRLRLAVVGQPDATTFRLPAEAVVLFLAHVRDSSDTDWARSLLQQIAASGRSQPTVILADRHLPTQALALFQHGAIDYLARPVDLNRLSYVVEMLTVRARHLASGAPDTVPQLFDGESPGMQRLMEQVLRVAPQETTVLLSGETGTGKTRLGRLIHEHSPRSDRPFRVVNCGALAANLIESEMFGHVRGAFTGADREHTGKFAEVGRGTILLDEVDALPPSLQAKLLRVLGEKVFEPVGSNKSQPLEARLIAATNRDLVREVEGGRFRADLYYRINVVGFCLPPLRERRTVIPSLCTQFIGEFAASRGCRIRSIDPLALEALVDYSWPGNIRELRNVIERAVVLCPASTIRLDDLPDEIVQTKDAPSFKPIPVAEAISDSSSLEDARVKAEHLRIVEALRRNMNNRVRAAAELGISRMTLYNKLQKYKIA
jgi:DNA-binding NtrC family response regulator